MTMENAGGIVEGVEAKSIFKEIMYNGNQQFSKLLLQTSTINQQLAQIWIFY